MTEAFDPDAGGIALANGTTPAPVAPAAARPRVAPDVAPLTPDSDFAVQRAMLTTEIDALLCCIEQREPRVRHEVETYLRGARGLLDADVPHADGAVRLRAARTLFGKATALYYGYVAKTNRLWYVGGVLASAALLATVVPLVLYAAALGLGALLGTFALEGAAVLRGADLPALLVLFGFAGLGSAVSVLSRIDKLELPRVFTRQLVVISGAGRPVVAVVFAVVVYALVKGQLVNLQPANGTLMHPAGIVHWWCVVVAFLSGYSERFASDLLGQPALAHGGDAPAAPLAVAPTPAAAPADGMAEARRG